MTDTHIRCPNCGFEIPISEALSVQIRGEVETALKADHEARLKQAAAQADAKAREEGAIQIQQLQENLASQRQKARTAQEAELKLRQEKTALEERARELDLEVARKVDAAKAELETGIRKAAAEEQALKLSPALAVALREQLISVNYARAATAGKGEKRELLYEYLSGTEFRQRVEAIVEAFEAMQLQLYRERRAMEKQWAEREKQVARVIGSTSAMYGALQGIVGAGLALDPRPGARPPACPAGAPGRRLSAYPVGAPPSARAMPKSGFRGWEAADEQHCDPPQACVKRQPTTTGPSLRPAKGARHEKRLEYQVTFNTPAFLGNADQQAQWRTPPFKALIRQWWRVVHAPKVNYDVDALRRHEAALFGVAADGGDSRRSLVRFRLSPWAPGDSNVGRRCPPSPTRR